MFKKSFTENAFKVEQEDGQIEPKRVIVVDAPDGDPETIPSDAILVMRNYKSNIGRGKRDFLIGRDVVCVSTPKGKHFYDLEDIVEFANTLYTVGLAIKSKLEFPSDETEAPKV